MYRKLAGIGCLLLCGCAAEDIPEAPQPVTVALIGDSIFYGVWMPNRTQETIEGYLADLLNEEDAVLNFGVPGAALQSAADQPYINESAYRKSLQCSADYYIILLGTNDATPYNWNKERFAAEYRTFLQTYIDLTDNDHVCAVIPPQVYEDPYTHIINYSVVQDALYEETVVIREAAEEAGVQCVDLYTLTQKHPEWFWDGVHPNKEGNRAIAEEIYRCLFTE